MSTGLDVLRFLRDAAREGQATALIALVNVIGVASRAPGALMGVTGDGRIAGSLSGGCVEAALAGEARRVMASGHAALLRLGTGSPLIDIRLPCGGGFDLLIVPNPDPAVITAAAGMLERREPVTLQLSTLAPVQLRNGSVAAGWRDGSFAVRLFPAMKLLIMGHGEEAIALLRLAIAYGAEAELWSPARNIVDSAQILGAAAHFLASRGPDPCWRIDPATAVVLVLHDHDREPALLARLLRENPFFIGAMGSRLTHAHRISALRTMGVSETDLARITCPIGLIPSTRDPDTLALSVLAQAAQLYQQKLADSPPVFERNHAAMALA